MWTEFWDAHSGGEQKESFKFCYIEADRKTAERIFEERFGHDPYNVTCPCCGDDYFVDEYDDTLENITDDHRRCANKCIELDKWLLSKEVCVIYKEEIKQNED